MDKIFYYRCFSINLLRFLKSNQFRYVSKFIHTNGKTGWVFKVTPELSRVLTAYSEMKKQDI